jgi:hypothetical protein
MVAIVGRPAPKFKGSAVIDGEIKTISSDDYKGDHFSSADDTSTTYLLHCM